MAAAGLVLAELKLREDRRCIRRQHLGPFAPEAGQPVAQLAVAGLAVEDSLDHELRGDGAVPVVLLEPEGDVEPELLPEAVDLPAEAERDRAAGVTGAVLDPKAKMLAVTDCGDLAELAAGHEQGHAGVAEPERRQARELGAQAQRQLCAVRERIDHGPRPELLLPQIRIGMQSKGRRE